MKECLEVMESLYDILSMINTGTEKIRGTDMSGNIVDGVLQFQVTYAFSLLEAKDETNMEKFEVRIDGRG